MMITEKTTIKCEYCYDDEHVQRYYIKKIWDKNKPLVCVIMLHPCESEGNNLVTEYTGFLVTNNVARMEKYGGVIMVNLFSRLTDKLRFKEFDVSELTDENNNQQILDAVESCEITVLAWGCGTSNSKHITNRVMEVLNMLKPYADKIHVLSEGTRSGMHPLCPSLHNSWSLEKVNLASV